MSPTNTIINENKNWRESIVDDDYLQMEAIQSEVYSIFLRRQFKEFTNNEKLDDKFRWTKHGQP